MTDDSVPQHPDWPQPARDRATKVLSDLVGKNFPVYVVDGLVRYLAAGIRPGSFLTAVLENDLGEAVRRADEPSERCLGAIVRWLFDEAPAVAWGSAEIVATWIEEHRREREGVAS